MPDRIAKPGIFFGMSAAQYYADPCPEPSLTQSIAKVLIERSPAHARLEHPRLAPYADEDEPAEKYVAAQAIGSAAHRMLIGRGAEIAVVEADAWRSDAAKKARAEAEAAGHIPILAKHNRRALAMVEAAYEQIDAAGWEEAFSSGNGEVVLAWQEGDLWLRTMIDWRTRSGHCYDYKTTGLSVAPHAIPHLMLNGGWEVQAAMHERGLDILEPAGAGRRKFRFIAQENTPPYALSCVELPEAALTMGRKKLDHAVDLWAQAMATGKWPAYPPTVIWPEYPGWAETKWLDIEMRHAERKTPERREPTLMNLGG